MKNGNRFYSAGALVLACAFSAIAFSSPQDSKEQKIKPSELPAAVMDAIRIACPNCEISSATREVENGVTIYDIEFKTGQGELDVAEDGSVIDRETVVSLVDIPPAALAAIQKAGGKITQIVKDEVRAELKDGNIIKLDTPRYLYEADLAKGNQVAEIQVSAEGEVIEAPQWHLRKGKRN
jgi:uncharacterized membrane protein YkoI